MARVIDVCSLCGGTLDIDEWRDEAGGTYATLRVPHDCPWEPETRTTPDGRTDVVGLKLRPGDQQLPVVNDEPDVQSQVIADIEERRKVGISRYGTALQPFNGRDAVRDLYEELLDGAMYAKQWLLERDRLLARIAELERQVADARQAHDDDLQELRGVPDDTPWYRRQDRRR